jgi:hypothetical protein
MAEHPATANKVMMIASAAGTRETSFINDVFIRSVRHLFQPNSSEGLCA